MKEIITIEPIIILPYKSRGLGQAEPEPSREGRLWPGLKFHKAKAASSQAKAAAFRPSRAVHSPNCTQHLPMLATTPIYVGHNTSHLRRSQHLFTSAKTLVYVVACIGHNTCLCRPQHLFTSATTPAYIGHNTSHLRRPQHLLTSASALTCVGHNTSHLHRPQHLFTSAKTLVYVSHNTCLHRPVL